MTAPTISLAAFRAMMETILAYVPLAQRENARAAALAIGIGYAYPPPKRLPSAKASR